MKKEDKKKLDKMADKVLSSPKVAPLPFSNGQLLLIEHDIDGSKVHQRPRDGYVNATELCKKTGKLIADYLRLNSTKAYLEALSTDMGIPISVLVHIVKGGNATANQGTWVHPDVAVHLGQWLSPRFAVQVSRWVRDWIQGSVSGKMPSHVRRYIANRRKIPHTTHFSMLNEIFLNLIAPLEDEGFHMPDSMLPDASTGRMFSAFLRREGIDPTEFPDYDHEFSDHRPNVRARLYPLKYLESFRQFFNEEWLSKHSKEYFAKRAPLALPHLDKIRLLPSPQGDTEGDN